MMSKTLDRVCIDVIGKVSFAKKKTLMHVSHCFNKKKLTIQQDFSFSNSNFLLIKTFPSNSQGPETNFKSICVVCFAKD